MGLEDSYEVADLEKRLEEIQNALDWSKYTYLEVDFMLRGTIDDFFKLLSTFCTSGHSADEKIKFASTLCELSRSARFLVGELERIPEDLCTDVNNLFVLGRDLVDAFGEPSLDIHAENIGKPVDILLTHSPYQGVSEDAEVPTNMFDECEGILADTRSRFIGNIRGVRMALRVGNGVIAKKGLKTTIDRLKEVDADDLDMVQRLQSFHDRIEDQYPLKEVVGCGEQEKSCGSC